MVVVGGGGGTAGGGGSGVYLRELDNFEKLGSNSPPMWHYFVSKNPLDGPSNLGLISSSLSSRTPVPKSSVN